MKNKKNTGSNPPRTKKGDTTRVLIRLLRYMTGSGSGSKFTGAMVLQVIGLLALITIPHFMGNAVNTFSGTDSTPPELRLWALLAMGAGIIYVAMNFIATRSFASLAANALSRLQCHLFDHMQTLSLSFFDSQPLGELMSRVTNDTESVALFFESAVSQMIRAVIQISMIIIVMLIFNWQLALAALTIVPVMLFLTGIIERISTPAFASLQRELGELSGFQEETISGNKVIISNRRQQWAQETHEKLAGGIFKIGSKAFFASLFQFPLTNTLIMIQIIIVLLVGGIMVVEGSTTLGVVISFIGYAGLLSTPLSEIANLSSTTLNAAAGARRVFTIIDEEAEITDAPDAVPFEFKGGRVEFKDVDFSYVPGSRVLRHNTFEALPGQMIGICGPTGAGKSTIINLLTRYYDIDRGTILIDGQDLKNLTRDSLRRQIGVVLQEAFLFTDTVMNNLKYAREGATDEDCIAAARLANAHEFIMRLPQGYETMLTERGANLSQGQRQMITIARAMVAQPKLLILDEATSNVDTRTEKLIQEGLQHLMSGKTSFSIAHRLSTIRPAAKILVLREGEIIEQGSHAELMAARGFYFSLYMSQFKGRGPAAVL